MFTFSAEQSTEQNAIANHRLLRASQSYSSISRSSLSNDSLVPFFSEDRILVPKITREILVTFLQDQRHFPLIRADSESVNLLPPVGGTVGQFAEMVEMSLSPEIETLLTWIKTDEDAQEVMDSFYLFYHDTKIFEQIALEMQKKEDRAYNREQKHPGRLLGTLAIFMVVLAICSTLYWITIHKDNPDAALGYYIMVSGLSTLALSMLGCFCYRAVREDDADFAVEQAARADMMRSTTELSGFTEESTALLINSEEVETIACLQGKCRALRSCLLDRKFHQQVKELLAKHGVQIVEQLFSLAQEVRLDLPTGLLPVNEM